MKCSIKGCPGEYEDKLITHLFGRDGKMVAVKDIPAEVCNVCGDTLIKPEVVEAIHELLDHVDEVAESIPALRFRSKVA